MLGRCSTWAGSDLPSSLLQLQHMQRIVAGTMAATRTTLYRCFAMRNMLWVGETQSRDDCSHIIRICGALYAILCA